MTTGPTDQRTRIQNLIDRSRTSIFVFCKEVLNFTPVGDQIQFLRTIERLTLEPDLRPKQMGCKAGTGVGKCIRRGEEVLTADGPRAVEDLEGTTFQVPSYDPATGRVSMQNALCFAQPAKECITLTLSDGTALSVTHDHPLIGGNGKTEARRFKPGDPVAVSRGLPVSEYPSLAEVMLYAALLADGNFTGTSVRLTDQNKPPLQRALRAAVSLGFVPVQHKTREEADCQTWGINGSQTWARDWGLNTHSKYKRLDRRVLFAPEPERALFLNTFADHDGHVDRRGVLEITLASKGLVEDIRLLFRSLGIVSGVKYKRAACQTGTFDAWRLTVSDFRSRIGGASQSNPNLDLTPWTVDDQREFHVTKHQLDKDRLTARQGSLMGRPKLQRLHDTHDIADKAWWCEHDLTWLKVVDVEEIGEQEVFDLSVDNTHWFLANGVWVHNTACLTVAVLWRWWISPGSKHVNTAPTERQCREVFFAEIAAHISRSDVLRPIVNLGGAKLTMKDHPHWKIFAATASDENAIRGNHHPDMTIAVEELTGIREDIIGALLRTCSQPNNLFLAIFNPDRTAGTAYEMFHSRRSHWPWNMTISKLSLAKDRPDLIDPIKIEEVREEFGEDSDMWRVGVLGEFPTEGSKSIITIAMIESAMKANQQLVIAMSRPIRVISVDFARFGGDENAIYVRSGNAIVHHEIMITEPELAARRSRDLMREMNWSARDTIFVVDSVGVGHGLIFGYLEKDLTVVEYHPKRRSPVMGYADIQSASWFNLRQRMKQNSVYIPNDPVLHEQLMTREFTYQKGNIEVESKAQYKARGFKKSPDRADALVMAFSESGDILNSLALDMGPPVEELEKSVAAFDIWADER